MPSNWITEKKEKKGGGWENEFKIKAKLSLGNRCNSVQVLNKKVSFSEQVEWRKKK